MTVIITVAAVDSSGVPCGLGNREPWGEGMTGSLTWVGKSEEQFEGTGGQSPRGSPVGLPFWCYVPGLCAIPC